MSRKPHSEFLSSLGTVFEVVKAIADEIRRAGGNPDECLRSLLNDKTRLKAVALAAIRPEPMPAIVAETVAVPDLPAAEQLATVEKEIGLTFVDGAYSGWNFVRDERGKVYEAATWTPGRGVSSETVRERFAALGGDRPFAGNTAAFLQWLRINRRDGWFVSIPDEDGIFRDAGDAGLCAPYFHRVGAYRNLGLNRVADDWDAGSVFVAFRGRL